MLYKLSDFIGKIFAIWAVIFGLLGFFMPNIFTGLQGFIVPILGIIMFGMGLTLKLSDFTEVVKRPIPVLVGVLAQFIIMPLIALLLVKTFDVDPMLAVGIILVGCCPGGTSSNVITFLSKGDVALSVTITSISTLLAPLVTPFLLQLYAGAIIDIPLYSMVVTIAKLVLFPIAAGVIIHYFLGQRIQPVISLLPMISVTGIVLIIAIVIALSQARIAESGLFILFIVILHNLLGYGLGFLLGRLCGFNLAQQRAIMVEVGMQNSGLGAALATRYFEPVSAVPSALFSVWHNISGAILANICIKIDNYKICK